MFFVDEKIVGQRVLLPELLVRLRTVRTDSENHRIHFPEPGKGVAKRARLTRSARGVVFRIEEENDVSAFERSQTDTSALVGLEIEIGSEVAFLYHRMIECMRRN